MTDRYGPVPDGQRRLSQTEVEVFLKCGLRWLWQHGNRQRTTVRLAIGSAVHVAQREDCKAQIEATEALPPAQLVGIALDEYKRITTENEIADGKPMIGQGEYETRDAAARYALHVSPSHATPLLVEAQILVQIDEGLQFAGTPDRIDATGVGDLKVGRQPTERRSDESRQLSAYAILHKARFGKLPASVWIDGIYRQKGKRWHSGIFPSVRTEEDCNRYIALLKRVQAAMAAGTLLPPPEGSWWCGSSWCPAWGEFPECPRRRFDE